MSTETFDELKYHERVRPLIDAAWNATVMAVLDKIEGTEYPAYMQPLIDAFKEYNESIWRSINEEDSGTS